MDKNTRLMDMERFLDSNPADFSKKFTKNSRFRDVRKVLGLNQSDFAKMLKTSQNQISRYEATQDIPYKIIELLSLEHNININWLITGKGEMFVATKNDEPQYVSESYVAYNSSITEELVSDIKQLSKKKQKYYYHRVKADLIDEKL
jgi:transcriptional regulator with XRE-family HTH domain